MSCYRPRQAHKSLGGEIWIGYDATRDGRAFELPCGRCIGCRLDNTRGWAVRITHEAQLYDTNWFATFTYRQDDLPDDYGLHYRDFQLFMKRLRRKLRGQRPGPEGNHPLRFFCAAEYGGHTQRPHFHAILFNLRLGDEKKLHNGQSWSGLIEELWDKGNVVLDDVNPTTAAYVAGYTLNKVQQNRGYTLGKKKRQRYEEKILQSTGQVITRRVAFATMSLNPGIGAWWYRDYAQDLFPGDFAIIQGKRTKVPRYYYNKFKDTAQPALLEEVEHARFLRAQERKTDNTPERRATREELAQRKTETFKERKL